MEIDTITYNGFHEFMANLGGYQASWGPVFAIAAPIFIINFFMKLSAVISGKYEDAYKKKLQDMLKKYADDKTEAQLDDVEQLEIKLETTFKNVLAREEQN